MSGNSSDVINAALDRLLRKEITAEQYLAVIDQMEQSRAGGADD